MAYQRTRKIEEQIRKYISIILHENIKDPRIGDIVSVTKVDLSKDIKYAKVYVSVYGDQSDRENAMGGLSKASGFIRKELANALQLRHVPELQFKLDTSIEHSITIAGIINKLSQENTERK